MKHIAVAAALLLVSSAIAAILAIQPTTSDEPPAVNIAPAAMPEPQVEGRSVVIVSAEGRDSSGNPAAWTTLCEFDAMVTTDGDTVTSVQGQSYGKKIAAGDRVEGVNDIVTSPDSHAPEIGASGQIHADLRVYWDSEGILRAGCAPESVSITKSDQ